MGLLVSYISRSTFITEYSDTISKDGKVDPNVLHTWFYILIAVAIAMVVYHGLKLMRS